MASEVLGGVGVRAEAGVPAAAAAGAACCGVVQQLVRGRYTGTGERREGGTGRGPGKEGKKPGPADREDAANLTVCAGPDVTRARLRSRRGCCHRRRGRREGRCLGPQEAHCFFCPHERTATPSVPLPTLPHLPRRCARAPDYWEKLEGDAGRRPPRHSGAATREVLLPSRRGGG